MTFILKSFLFFARGSERTRPCLVLSSGAACGAHHMFVASFGMSQSEYFASGGAAEHNVPEAKTFFVASDAGSLATSSDDEELNITAEAAPAAAAGWESGVRERGAARTAKKWPDGEPVGRGHGSPYLKERWAHAMAAGIKKVEGRPDEGVRCRTQPTSHPNHPTIDIIDLVNPVHSGLRMSRRATTSHSR